MSYISLNPTYLVKFIGSSSGHLVLLPYFELDEHVEQLRHVDFIVKLKEGLKFDITKCVEHKDIFANKYTNAIKFNDILTVDNIERFKLSPSLWSKESYLKQIYDGKIFDMEKINNIVLISSEFLQDNNSFTHIKNTLSKNNKTKKLPNYLWLFIILMILLLGYVSYEYFTTSKN